MNAGYDLRPHIRRARQNVIDYEIVVDDKRAVVMAAVDDLRDAIRERDRAAVHLAHLIELHYTHHVDAEVTATRG